MKGISIDPKILHGVPVIAGTRMSVSRILGALASGMSQQEVMHEYKLSAENIRDAMRYAADVLESERVYPISN